MKCQKYDYVICKEAKQIINETFCELFCTKPSKSGMYFYTHAFQVLSSHIRLVATIFNSMGLDPSISMATPRV